MAYKYIVNIYKYNIFIYKLKTLFLLKVTEKYVKTSFKYFPIYCHIE